jgi:pyruvate dehydrogenase E1 component
VVPNIAAHRLQKMFAAAGWQVITVMFGTLLEEILARPGGTALRERIPQMSKPSTSGYCAATPTRCAPGSPERG